MTERKAGSDKPGGPRPPGRAGGRKEDWIGKQLRRVYDEALQEEIPPDMLALLGRLDETRSDEEEGGR